MRAAKRRSNPDGEGPRARLLRSARNDGGCCHCESRSGEAIQPGKALTLDCFARQCAARLPPAHNDDGLARTDRRARNKV
ncbi:MAG: hypothetical protein LBT00_02100 [Spirochaetaceae bacterium]|nr:hypothetical protein [Spirochaetaceae bacterium]